MWDMRCGNDACCGLSKGTQSDGLISDTSEEFTSSSSSEDFQQGRTCEKAIATESKEVRHESVDSMDLILSTSFSQIQTKRHSSYIRWGALLSFGLLLWVALWVTDIFNPHLFSKEDLATAKKITSKAGLVIKPAPRTWWFFDLWNYVWNFPISITTFEIFMILSGVTILIYLESYSRSKWGGTIGTICYEQIHKTLVNAEAEQCEKDCDFHLNTSELELTLGKPELKSCGDNLSKFSHGDMRNPMPRDNIDVMSKLGRSMQCLSQGETSSMENCTSKCLRGARTLNTTKKRSLQTNDGKNCCNFSRRSKNLCTDLVTSELILNRPNFDLSSVSSSTNGDKNNTNAEQSSFSCSIFNKSTSIMSEKIETWFELRNSNEAEKVMHTFDAELEEFFKIRSRSSSLPFSETTEMQQYNNNSVACGCNGQSETVILNVNYGGGIISSSPAFRRFLVNLAKDRLAEPCP